ncbi:metabolite transporter, MFS superfamily protein (plasmid) [Rhodococcus jostii RHA1]|uniref:Putative proline/betaine transporter n=1 Tax=Rhodococcus jostii (strain RHA1) TaxID=101510 RepID=Q0RXW2_RHOJR|nr:MFS transporter [Rhodococcus jostii]ABG99874.1 metabolite transporter, MFS superfamily protein [Rhodococcus jostii RHA1]
MLEETIDQNVGVHEPEPSSLRRVAISSMMGTVLEWYDYFIFGFAAVLVFGQLFFPQISPVAGTLAALGTFLAGFIARPIGGLLFGHFGDRLGRKTMLIWTIAIMGVGSFLIGILPTYEQWGIWAAVCLVILRFIQGIGLGGEWGGAALMTVECAPVERRGFWGSIVQLGAPGGQALATTVLFGLSYLLPEQAFLSWGWRVPFLLGAALLVLALYIRLKVMESPAFRDMEENGEQVKLPLLEVFKSHRMAVLRTFFIYLGGITVPFYITWIFLVSYATGTLQLDRSAVLLGVTLVNLALLAATIAGGSLSDKLGRRPVCLIGLALLTVLAFPVIAIANLGTVSWVWLAMLLFGLPAWFMWGALPAFFAELFPTQVRYSGLSLGAQGSTILGGMVPMFATAVVPIAGTWPVAALGAGCALVTAVLVYVTHETLGTDLSHVEDPGDR